MRFLRDITMTVCILSLIYTALMMLVPDRFRRELRTVLAMTAAVTLGAMLLGADMSDISTQFGGLSFDAEDIQYKNMVQSELEARLEEYITTLLSESGTEVKKLTVRTTIDEQNRISITEASLELDGVYRGQEAQIRGLLSEKIGDIEVKISYEDS